MAVTASHVGVARFRPVEPGGRIGLVAPASPFARADFDAGVAELERLGFVPVYDERVFERERIVAGSPAHRAAVLREYFERRDIDAVLAVRGGYGSAETLPLLDAGMVRRARKPFVGYSDVTAIHTFLTCHVGLASLHGPMIEGRLATGDRAYDSRSLQTGLSTKPLGELAPEGLEILRAGEAAGPVFGGTLSQLCASLGTPFAFAPPTGHVLLLDEVGERPYRIRRMLTQLAQAGILARAAAILIGQLPKCDEPGGEVTGLSVFADLLHDFPGPVVARFPTGHSIAPLVTLPLGIPARLVARARPGLVFDTAAAADQA